MGLALLPDTAFALRRNDADALRCCIATKKFPVFGPVDNLGKPL